MRDYEIVYIFRSTFSPEEIEAKLEPYHALITNGGSGEITAVVQWGKRQLAYPIDKQTTGHYVVAQFTAEPDRLAELERVLKLQDDLLRYLVVLSEGELPLPETMHQSREVTGSESAATPAAEAPGAEAPAAEPPAAGAEAEAPAAEAEASAAEAEGDSAAETESADEATEGDDAAAFDDGEAAEDADVADDEKTEDVEAAEGEA